MKRIKLTKPALKTRTDMGQCLSEIRELTIAREQINVNREAAIKAIDERCGPELDAINKQLEEKAQLLEVWSVNNTTEFNGKKSLETIHGFIGWRIGQPKIKKIRGYDAECTLNALKDLLPEYIRVKEEANNQAIIADREKIGPDKLALCGIKIAQEEVFYVEPKVEQQETRITS